MALKPRDPLLAAARFIIDAGIAVLGLGIAALLVGLPALLLNKARVLAEITRDGTTVAPEFFLSASAVIVLAIALLALAVWFLIQLRRIVGTVSAGDPFIIDNAVRLARMGWMALAGQLMGIPLGIAARWMATMVSDSDKVQVGGDFGFSGGGVVLVIVLFVLARVFRQGARMRDELEGTV